MAYLILIFKFFIFLFYWLSD